MPGSAVEFVRNMSLLGLLNLLTSAVFVLIGLATIARPCRITKRVAWGMVPLVTGVMTLYFDYRFSDRSMFGLRNEFDIAMTRADAFVSGIIGVMSAGVFIGTGLLANKLRTGQRV